MYICLKSLNVEALLFIYRGHTVWATVNILDKLQYNHCLDYVESHQKLNTTNWS